RSWDPRRSQPARGEPGGDPASVSRRSQTSIARRSRTAATNAGVGSFPDGQRAVLAKVLVVGDRVRKAIAAGLQDDRVALGHGLARVGGLGAPVDNLLGRIVGDRL